jgi:hypothetical protein
MSVALCLIALSLGYLVLYQASYAKEGLKILGQAIGVIVVIVSILSATCCLAQAVGDKWFGAGMVAGCPISGSGSK